MGSEPDNLPQQRFGMFGTCCSVPAKCAAAFRLTPPCSLLSVFLLSLLVQGELWLRLERRAEFTLLSVKKADQQQVFIRSMVLKGESSVGLGVLKINFMQNMYLPLSEGQLVVFSLGMDYIRSHG